MVVATLSLAGCGLFASRAQRESQDFLSDVITSLDPLLDGEIRYRAECPEFGVDCSSVGWFATVITDDDPEAACEQLNTWATDNHADRQHTSRRRGMARPGYIRASDITGRTEPYDATTLTKDCVAVLSGGKGLAAIQGSITPAAEAVGVADSLDELGLSDLYTVGLTWDEKDQESTASIAVMG